jgi:hypothetical protein
VFADFPLTFEAEEDETPPKEATDIDGEGHD